MSCINYEHWEEDKAVEVKKRFVIFDTDTVLWITTPTKKDGIPPTFQECKDNSEKLIQDILDLLGADYYVCCYTIRNDINFRKQYYPLYKANRTGKELPEHFIKTREYLLFNSKFKAVTCLENGYSYESDDLCVSYYKQYKDTYDCIIASPDKDLKELNIPCYDYKKHEYNNPSQLQEDYSLAYDLIAGQPGDGITGLPGLGDKAAIKLLDSQLEEDFIPIVIKAYIKKYGTYNGIEQFYSNYKALKILDEIPNFILPEINEYIRI